MNPLETNLAPRGNNLMRIIDRYILRQFVQTFLICFVSLVGLYVVFDAFTNLESFLKAAGDKGGLLGIIVSYYAYQSLAFFDMTAGILALIAAMFTITWLQRHNEMTALMAAGVPRFRAALPVIVAAGSIAVLATVNRELIMPRYRAELRRKPSDLAGEVSRSFDSRYDEQTDIVIRGDAAYSATQRISKPSFQLPPRLATYGTQLVAENAFFRSPKEDRPGGYLLVGVRQPRDLASRESLYLDGRPVILTPKDFAWLKPDECFVVSKASFDLLTEGLEYASTARMIAGLRNPSLDFGAGTRVAIHARMVHPFTDLTLLFLGIPLVMTGENRNIFKAIGLCITVVGIFVLVLMAFQYLGTTYLIPPHLAAWAPLLVFVPVAVAMSSSMWK
ncbi:MAG: YjgP/YjgQ family permease [Pirellulaceae bacterium]|nr:YjgP/YjgQ family permease [Pirellulaceae bacterium]